MKSVVISIIVLFLIAGCSDTVRTKFATLSAAKEAGAFNRGWLPPALPDGTTQIVEINNLDTNIGEGTFCFPIDSTSAYLETMKTKFNATITEDSDKIFLEVAKGKTKWKIQLDPNKGQGKYSVKQGSTSM